MVDIQSISLFSPSQSLSLSSSLSLHHLPPFWVSYIYFSEVFLIWQGSRPGRFSPWLQLLSQLLSPAGAALCWVPTLHLGPCFLCVCMCVSSVQHFLFTELGVWNPDRCLSVVNSPHWNRPPKVSCLSATNSAGTVAVLSVNSSPFLSSACHL